MKKRSDAAHADLIRYVGLQCNCRYRTGKNLFNSVGVQSPTELRPPARCERICRRNMSITQRKFGVQICKEEEFSLK